MEITSIQKLDDVLRYIEGEYKKESLIDISQIKNPLIKFSDIEDVEILPILNKLVKDGYLDVHIVEMKKTVSSSNNLFTRYKENYYAITFEGKYFIEIGGYVRQEELNLEQKTQLALAIAYRRDQADILNRLTCWLVFGTISAAAIALLLLLWEIRHPILRLLNH